MESWSYRVELRVPGKLAFVPVARLTTSSLALQTGFTFAEARKVTQAVTEVLRCLIRSSAGRPRPVMVLNFLVSSSRIAVEMRKDEDGPEALDLWLLAADCGGQMQLLRLSQLVDAIDINWDRRRGVSVTLTKYRRESS
jgi:anti-sigma regulatory factor (Ser/Thr protein kinase)